MENFFYNSIFKIYRLISPNALKSLIPVIDLARKFNSKPPIPKKEKMAEIVYPKFEKKVIMLHGVSVGEVNSLENLIKKIKNDFPGCALVITTGTVTGQELAHKKYSEYADFITYFPLDTYKTVDKFLTKINPSVILIAETELWPNFSYCAKEKNIPLYIINGRISDKSYPSYKKFKGFFKLIFDCYTGVFAQSESDRERFISLGSDENKTQVMKNLKFEIEKKPAESFFNDENFKIMVAGSTHKGEEEIVLRVYKKLKEKEKDLKLILAPRHLTRLDEVKACLKDFNYGLRTNKDELKDFDIILLDTLGELSKIYAIANFAFIGGSFNKTGGHNPLEATVYSKPTISGPSIKNFRDIYAILQRDEASFVVKNEEEFYSVAEKLITDKDFYNSTSKNCKNCFEYQQGALDFVINKLQEIL